MYRTLYIIMYGRKDNKNLISCEFQTFVDEHLYRETLKWMSENDKYRYVFGYDINYNNTLTAAYKIGEIMNDALDNTVNDEYNMFNAVTSVNKNNEIMIYFRFLSTKFYHSVALGTSQVINEIVDTFSRRTCITFSSCENDLEYYKVNLCKL